MVKFSKQSTHWKRGNIRMETFPEFGFNMQKGDHFLSFDIKKGYYAFCLAPAMRDLFIFHYMGRYYQCVGLPLGWTRSPLWFTQLMAVFSKELRKHGMRALAYIEDFLVAPTPPDTVDKKGDCVRARRKIEGLLKAVGLSRNLNKGEWEGSQKLIHLGVEVKSSIMRFRISTRKLSRV